MGSLIMIAITLVAGAAIFGFVNGQSGNSAQAVGDSTAKNINFLNEREVLVYAALGGTSPSPSANIWVYNNGLINPENMTNVQFYDKAAPGNVCTVQIPKGSGYISTSSVRQLTVSVPSTPTTACPSPIDFQASHAYTFIVIGQYGSTSQLTVPF